MAAALVIVAIAITLTARQEAAEQRQINHLQNNAAEATQDAQDKAKQLNDALQREEQLEGVTEQQKQEIDKLKTDLQAKADAKAKAAQIAAAARSSTSPAAGKTSNNTQNTPTAAYAVGCALYEPIVRQHFGEATPAAMTVMQKESGCNPNAISPTNDHGLFQLNGMPIYDPAANVAAAYQKYINPRRGTTPNWSAWYAVCSPALVPLVGGIWCS